MRPEGDLKSHLYLIFFLKYYFMAFPITTTKEQMRQQMPEGLFPTNILLDRKRKWCPGLVAHACNHNILGGQCGRMTR